MVCFIATVKEFQCLCALEKYYRAYRQSPYKRTLPSLSEHHDAMVWTENVTLTWSMIVEVAFLMIEGKHRAKRIMHDYLNSLFVLA